MTITTIHNSPPSHPLAIVGLVLGILGLTGILPLVGSIGAMIAGKMAQKEIEEKPALYGGGNLARAGVIMGWIGLVVIALVLAFACLFFLSVSTQTVPFP